MTPDLMRPKFRDGPAAGTLVGERVYRSGGIALRYLLEPATEDPTALIVAFAAAHEPEEPPRYYTIRALRGVGCHRLFVLDDQGPPGPFARPSWYLGANRQQDVPGAVLELLETIATELKIGRDRVITCGASKGGWAALYFAARYGAAHAVAGEPQVFLGRHLLQDGTHDIAAHVAGGSSPADGEYLDALLFNALTEASDRPQIDLYCGRGSFYYQHHVLPLVRFLRETGITFDLTLGDYDNHVPDLGRHFPTFLVQRLRSLIATTGQTSGAGAGPAQASNGEKAPVTIRLASSSTAVGGSVPDVRQAR
jgi:hypothetical protein